MFSLASLLLSLAFIGSSSADVTIYTTLSEDLTSTSSAVIPYTTGNSAYSQLVLQPPTPPTGLPQQWPISIPAVNTLANLSMAQKGNYLGFSVELSVVGQVLGLNSTFLAPPFLNYLGNIKERAGAGPVIRVGGNTQDQSTMYDHTFLDKWNHPQMVQKWYADVVNGNPTGTPNINFAEELFYTMGNITGLLNVDWYFGLQFDQPYNDSNAMWVAQTIEEILGPHLLSLQVGNEPDLYANHLRRPSNYSIPDYITEFQSYMNNINSSPIPDKKIVLGPSICCMWSTQQVFDAGWLTQFANNVNYVGLMHYPNDNCAIGGALNPQDELAAYLTHQSALTFANNYASIIPPSLAAGMAITVLETNTASCGGFPGISDAFTAPLWAIDNALELAAWNISNFMIHVGGQSDSYNPFTPPPGNISATHGWTTGAVYYAALAVAETFGSSNQSQITDLNTESDFRPAYAIYENGQPSRVALFNYASDPTGASDYQAVISIAGTTVPSSVSVRYLSAPSVTEKFNITWAGQTMGSAAFMSDGRLQGEQTTVTIQCDQANNQCIVPVRAPEFALVFLTEQALTSSGPPPGASTLTFATTATTKLGAHPIIPEAVLATMNGEGGPGQRYLGSTGKGTLLTGAASNLVIPAFGTLVGLVVGCVMITGGARLWSR